jgi:hypothetical protein
MRMALQGGVKATLLSLQFRIAGALTCSSLPQFSPALPHDAIGAPFSGP